MSNNPPRVLVVEDEAIVSMDIMATLKNLNYPVVDSVSSGEEAIKVAKTKKPDIILMDIHLSREIDGIEAAKTIRSSLLIPVIFLTAYANDKLLERAKKTGSFAYVLKPFTDEGLKAAIENSLYKAGMEYQLMESEKKYSSLVENANDAIYILQDNKFKYANKAFLKLFGYSKKELDEVDDFMELVAHEDTKLIQERAKKMESQETSELENRYEFMGLRKDGEKRFLSASVSGINYHGKPARQGILRDITKEKQAQEKKEKFEKARNDYIHFISKDIKTPVKSMMKWLRVIEKKKDDIGDKCCEALGVMERNLQRLNKIEHSISQLNLIETSEFLPKKEPMFLHFIAKNIFNDLKFLAEENEVIFENHVPMMNLIKADPEMITEVFSIILENAIKYIAKGGRVKMYGEQQGDKFEIRIKDNGFGIPEKEREKVFERFHRVKDRRYKVQGAGLGLSIAKGIILAHNGKIWIESEKNAGTTVHFTLPRGL